ncbi:MAG: hypothetical protein ACRC3G_09500 [Bacteroidales bacterium]
MKASFFIKIVLCLVVVYPILFLSGCSDELTPGDNSEILERGDLTTDSLNTDTVGSTEPQISTMIRARGAIGLLGFTKDKEGNYIVMIRQNNAYDNVELRVSKCDPEGKFIADKSLLGATSQDGGQTEAGRPGGSGSGRLAYNPDRNEFAFLTCYTGKGHQYSSFNVLSNEDETFGNKLANFYGGQTYSHSFDQRLIYHKLSKMYYQMQHGDAYPRAMGIASVSMESNANTFWVYLVRPPKSNTSYGGNSTRTRIGDIAVFDNGDVASTISTPFYDNAFIQAFLPYSAAPCYSYASGADADLSVEMWNAAGDGYRGRKYTMNICLDITKRGSKSVVVDGSLGISPTAVNLSGYPKGSATAAGIPKTAIFGSEVLVAWLTYSDYNYNGGATTLQHTVFCVYNTITKTIVRKDSVPGAEIFHTASILSYDEKAVWITPNEGHFIYHELDINTFKTSGLGAAHTKREIPLNVMGGKTAKAISGPASGQFSSLGPYGFNPDIDYVINDNGSMHILWMNKGMVIKEHGFNFSPIYITSIDNQGRFTKVIEVPVRSIK